MYRNRRLMLVVAAIVVLPVSPACVSKKLFRQNSDQVDSRVRGVENMVEENERRISDLKSETDARVAQLDGRVGDAMKLGEAAMGKANDASMMADKAMKGKLLWSVTLSSDKVKFGFGKAELSDAAKAELSALAGQIKGYGKAVYVEIEGHTDNIGGEAYNVQLGHQRAMAALRYLNESGGIPLHALNAISFGSSKPVADNGTKDGRSQNRRVVVKVLE